MRGSSGYAIAEVLVAVVIISISFIELSGAISKIMRSANQTALMGKSISVAHSTMEEVMAQSFDAKGSEAGGYVLEFNGSGDHLDCGDVSVINGASALTISGWINPDMASGNDIIYSKNGVADDNRILLYIDVDNEDLYIKYENGGTNQYGKYTSFTTASYQNKWTHFAVVFNGSGSGNSGKLKLYINGADLALSFTGTIATTITDASGHPFYIAKSDADYFDGKMDEVRIWNVARSEEEILDNYKSGITDPYAENELKLYLRMNNGAGAVAFDHSNTMAQGTITGATWTGQSSSWSTSLGKETEASWSEYNDVDDFHKSGGFTDSDYSQLGGRIYVKYVVVDPTSWAISDAGEGTITDYKQITVKIGIPGSTDSTQLSAIKSAKIIQNYGLTYSPYGN